MKDYFGNEVEEPIREAALSYAGPVRCPECLSEDYVDIGCRPRVGELLETLEDGTKVYGWKEEEIYQCLECKTVFRSGILYDPINGLADELLIEDGRKKKGKSRTRGPYRKSSTVGLPRK